jgi:GDP-4-dehydro-6-deoxy-D-mannose reductase
MEVGNLASVRDFLDVEDVLDAYLRLLDPDVPADIYNIASGAGCSIQSLLDDLLELARVDAEVVTVPERWRPADSLVGDATRLREASAWEPRTALRDTLGRLLDAWRTELERAGRSGAS